MSGPRSITSPLRVAQAARTRELLIETAAEFLATHGLDELTLPVLARLAKMSAPTAYAHFPTIDDLLSALFEWVQPRLGTREPLVAAEQLHEIPARRFPRYAEYGGLLRAIWTSRVWNRHRHKSRWPYIMKVIDNLRPLAPDLPDRQLNAATAVITSLQYPPMWQWLRDAWGLSDEDAVLACEWAIQTLVDGLHDRPPGAPRPRKRRR